MSGIFENHGSVGYIDLGVLLVRHNRVAVTMSSGVSRLSFFSIVSPIVSSIHIFDVSMALSVRY